MASRSLEEVAEVEALLLKMVNRAVLLDADRGAGILVRFQHLNLKTRRCNGALPALLYWCGVEFSILECTVLPDAQPGARIIRFPIISLNPVP